MNYFYHIMLFRDQYFININTIHIRCFFVFVFIEVPYFDFFLLSKSMLFPLILRRCEEKTVKFFYNNFAICAVVIYRCFELIDLIND